MSRSITAYNAHGQPLTIVDPNGLTTTLAYDARQRLTSRNGRRRNHVLRLRRRRPAHQGDAARRLVPHLHLRRRAPADRDRGQPRQPHRLHARRDGQPHRRSRCSIRRNSLAQTRSRVYNSLNRLFQELGAQSQTTEYAYDNQGNVTSVKDPLNTGHGEPVRRAESPEAGDRPGHWASRSTATTASMRSLPVTDPRSLVTGYTVDGLGNLTQQASPDTGTTTNTYDVGGQPPHADRRQGADRRPTPTTRSTASRSSPSTTARSSTTSTTGRERHRAARLDHRDRSGQPADEPTSLRLRPARARHRRRAPRTRGVIYNARLQLRQRRAPARPHLSVGRTRGLRLRRPRAASNQVTTTKAARPRRSCHNVAYHPFGGVKSYTLGNGQTYTRSDRPGRAHRLLHPGRQDLRHRLRRGEPHRVHLATSATRRTATPTATTRSTG